MRSLRFLVLSSMLACAAGGAIVAQTNRNIEPSDTPYRYFLRDLDGRLVRVESSSDGRTWAAWAYRSRGEYDIAVTIRDASGQWSAPTFIGAGDSLSQLQPSLAVDSNGNVYLAYAERDTGSIFLTMRAPGATSWSDPQPIAADGQRHWMPALRVVGTRLILAYRSPSGTEIVDFALLPPVYIAPSGIVDGPDGTPPSGEAPPQDQESPLGRN